LEIGGKAAHGNGKKESSKAASWKSSEGGSRGGRSGSRACTRRGTPTAGARLGSTNCRHETPAPSRYLVLSDPHSDFASNTFRHTSPCTTPPHSHAYHTTQIGLPASARPDGFGCHCRGCAGCIRISVYRFAQSHPHLFVFFPNCWRTSPSHLCFRHTAP